MIVIICVPFNTFSKSKVPFALCYTLHSNKMNIESADKYLN